jgi:type IV secretory pathway TraG/TraD family ATPase VirD4
MSEPWGRRDGPGNWQNPEPVWSLAALLIAMLSAVAVEAYQFAAVWTPLQRVYLSPYLRSSIAVVITRSGSYRVLTVIGRRGTRFALDDDVQPVTRETGAMSFALSEAGVRIGDVRLVWGTGLYDHAKLHAFLRRWIYRDQTLLDLVMPAVWSGLAVFVLGLTVGIAKDVTRTRQRKEGRRLKGPELVTADEFNHRLCADGVGFLQRPRLVARLVGHRRWVRVPRAREANHLLIMGDSGTGKSTLIRQILVQLEARGETAIVYDPALEYTPQFYTPDRGDLILNPLDARSPSWNPGDEVRHDAEARTLARSLFPDHAGDTPFFTEGSRRIFAHLLTFHPTAEELVWWLRHKEDIDRRVTETAYAAMIDPLAPAQRIGMLASLNMVADALALVPSEREATRRWSATAWATERKGWLFLTSTAETREALLPLTSLWLDTLVLRLMHHGQPGARPVWFMLDELATLQRLPQLHTAITENRKSHNPVVLGFQGRSQLETRYGHDAEAILSQAATKIFLGTSEAHAAKWISDTIGEVEIERLRESRSNGTWGLSRHSTSYGLERQVEPLVMASEITGLDHHRGYLKLGNLVVRLSGAFIDLPERQPAFIERPMPTHVRGTPSIGAEPDDSNPAPTRRLVVPDAMHASEPQANQTVEPYWQ